MSDDASRDIRRHRVLLVLAIVLLAANMRPAITAVGPLIQEIGRDTGLSATVLGLLGSIPTITWAIVSPLTQGLSRRFGTGPTMLAALVLLGSGTIVRSLDGPLVGLWLGTVIIGVAIAIVNVLMPAVVKRDFPDRVRVMTGLYSALIAGLGAVSSSIAVPIADIPTADGTLGWAWALLVIGLALLPFGIAFAIVHLRIVPAEPRPTPEEAAEARRAGRAIWRDGLAWLIALYMGFQSTVFYVVITWLATISQSVGKSPTAAGLDVGAYQVLSVCGSLLLPLVLRVPFRRFVPALLPLLGIAALLGLLLAPGLVTLWSIVLGAASGSWLAMSLTLMAERARDHATAGALSGMSQSVGYLIAAVGPIAFGALHAATQGWALSIGYLVLMLVALVVVGLLAARTNRHVLERDPGREARRRG